MTGTLTDEELDRLEGLYEDGCHGNGWRVECCHEATNGRYSRGGCCSAPSIVTTTDQGKQFVATQMISNDAEFAAAVHNAFPALLAAARSLAAVTAERDALRRANAVLKQDMRAAEAESAALSKALETEREECAQIADTYFDDDSDDQGFKAAAAISRAIRARAVSKEQTHAE